MKKVIFILATALFYCGATAQKQSVPPQEIQTVYFQKWAGGQELTGSGTDFYIEFQAPLPKNVNFLKIYFQEKSTPIEKLSETKFIARFHQKPELIIDEAGNRSVVHKNKIEKIKYKLANNEAIIEYEKGKRKSFFKLKNIKEKEMIAYPSAPPLRQD